MKLGRGEVDRTKTIAWGSITYNDPDDKSVMTSPVRELSVAFEYDDDRQVRWLYRQRQTRASLFKGWLAQDDSRLIAGGLSFFL